MNAPDVLVRHLDSWLGAWPPPDKGLHVVESIRRVEPGWDGSVRPVRGVVSPHGTVLSVPPGQAGTVRKLGDDPDTVGRRLPALLGLPGWRFHVGVFRWTEHAAQLERPGRWVPPDTAGIPEWLRPFNGDVLIGCAEGRVAAGVGRKRHDAWGHELAVVTEEAHRGRGWAAKLVAQAAVRVIDDGAIPTYLHAPDNAASARTADAAGFPDRGWKIIGMFPG